MSAPARVLLLEDSDDDAELISRALRDSGIPHELRVAKSREELRKAIAFFRPQAVISDFSLPAFDAFEALRIVHELEPELPFLCVSGTIGEEQAVELLKRGATDYVLKDRPARLTASLSRALAESVERAARRRAETELQSSREQFLQSQKMEAMGRLAGGVAHDFNNVLTTISGYCEILLHGLPEDSPHRPDVEEIFRAAERAGKLTRQLLAFSRRDVYQPRVLDLNELVNGFQRMIRRLIGEDIRIELALAPELPPIKADPAQLEQALMNLAVNARDAMPKGGLLSLSTSRRDGGVELAVSDTGSGMSPEVKARLFEPFFTTKEKGKGTGLGLATVYGVVQQSGGAIRVESAPGAGTTFRILLPATAEPLSQSRPPEAARREARGGAETVLIVEDEEPLRLLMRRVLSARGYRVLLGEDPAAALRAAEAEPRLALAIVDAVMPGMDGRSLIARLRQRNPGLKAILVSGYTDRDSAGPETGDMGFGFLPKPFQSAALLAMIRELLDRPR